MLRKIMKDGKNIIKHRKRNMIKNHKNIFNDSKV